MRPRRPPTVVAPAPSTSSGSRSIWAADVAVWTWGRLRCASPASASDWPGWAAWSWTRATSPRRFPKRKAERDPKKRYIREIARVCQKLYALALQSHEEGALPIVLGGDHSLAAGSVGATADFAATARRRYRPSLDRRPRRHEHAGDDDERQRARDAARGARSDRSRPSSRKSGSARPRCAPTGRCSSACAIWTPRKSRTSATRRSRSSR